MNTLQFQMGNYSVKHAEPELMSLKRNSLNNHIQSVKHKDRKIKLQEKEKRNQTIVQALQKYNKTHHTRGETLPLEGVH